MKLRHFIVCVVLIWAGSTAGCCYTGPSTAHPYGELVPLPPELIPQVGPKDQSL